MSNRYDEDEELERMFDIVRKNHLEALVKDYYNKTNFLEENPNDPDDYTAAWRPLLNPETKTAKSIGSGKRVSQKNKKHKDNLVRTRFVAVSLAAIMFLSGMYVHKKGSDWKERNDKLNVGITTITECAQKNLLDAGLAYLDENGNFIVNKENTPGDYQEKLGLNNNISPIEVRGYIEALPSSEVEEFIQGIPCSEDNVICYTGLNGPGSYLSQNGYYNPKDGTASYTVFENLTDADIINSIDKNGLSALKTIFSSENNTNYKGRG